MDSRDTRPFSSGINTRDRHSKVLTSRGLKDRRIRLSSETALKFYHIHHMLGFNQPTKSVEWLLHHAQPAVENLLLQATPATFEALKFKADDDLVQPELAWFDDQYIWSPSSQMNVDNPCQEEEEQQSRNHEEEDQGRKKCQKKDFFSIQTAHKTEIKPGWRESVQKKGSANERRAKARERARERSKHKNNNRTSLFSVQRRITSEFCESVGENVQNWHGLGFREETLGNTHLVPQDHYIAVQDPSVYSDHAFSSQNPFQSAQSNCMVPSMILSSFRNTCYDLEPSPLDLENGFYNP